jgi:hypothetical protein
LRSAVGAEPPRRRRRDIHPPSLGPGRHAPDDCVRPGQTPRCNSRLPECRVR